MTVGANESFGSLRVRFNHDFLRVLRFRRASNNSVLQRQGPGEIGSLNRLFRNAFCRSGSAHLAAARFNRLPASVLVTNKVAALVPKHRWRNLMLRVLCPLRPLQAVGPRQEQGRVRPLLAWRNRLSFFDTTCCRHTVTIDINGPGVFDSPNGSVCRCRLLALSRFRQRSLTLRVVETKHVAPGAGGVGGASGLGHDLFERLPGAFDARRFHRFDENLPSARLCSPLYPPEREKTGGWKRVLGNLGRR